MVKELLKGPHKDSSARMRVWARTAVHVVLAHPSTWQPRENPKDERISHCLLLGVRARVGFFLRACDVYSLETQHHLLVLQSNVCPELRHSRKRHSYLYFHKASERSAAPRFREPANPLVILSLVGWGQLS